MIPLKTLEQIEIMDGANRIVHKVLDAIEANICPGMATQGLDILSESIAHAENAKPAFKGYMGYPASLCVSVNEEIVHGIPSDRVIKEGDVVSVDFGAIYKGFVGDAARTIIIGDVSEEISNLVFNTKEALKLAVDKMRIGNRLYDIANTISTVAIKNKYGNIEKFCGHGVGEKMHEPPRVLNYIDKAEPNVRLQEGMVLALEPMFVLGKKDVRILKDKWTVVTADGSCAAHWEVSVAITKEGPRVLGSDTLFDD